MQIIAPDILAEARGLSVAICAAFFVTGLLVWLTGWWGHRFWIVLVATLIAGIAGLHSGPAYRMQPLVAGLLLAVAAGVLALALIRVVAFFAGGLAAWLVIHSLAPSSWDSPLVCFLAGGLVGVFLFRAWTMALTSLAGTALMAYSGLCIVDRMGKLDAVHLTEQRPILMNWACAGSVAVGFLVQFVMERRRIRKQKMWELEGRRRLSPKELEKLYGKRSWWKLGGNSYRRAG